MMDSWRSVCALVTFYSDLLSIVRRFGDFFLFILCNLSCDWVEPLDELDCSACLVFSEICNSIGSGINVIVLLLILFGIGTSFVAVKPSISRDYFISGKSWIMVLLLASMLIKGLFSSNDWEHWSRSSMMSLFVGFKICRFTCEKVTLFHFIDFRFTYETSIIGYNDRSEEFSFCLNHLHRFAGRYFVS